MILDRAAHADHLPIAVDLLAQAFGTIEGLTGA
jgi:hypothetical protein